MAGDLAAGHCSGGDDEICAILAITQVSQRVLLHRGRSKLRLVIGSEFGGDR